MPTKPTPHHSKEHSFSSKRKVSRADEEDEENELHEGDPKPGRLMGFPDMRYMDPEAVGVPVQSNITFYKKY